MVDIFTYTDYRHYLKDYCREIRKEKPCFSYRYLAQKTGLKSSGYISWVINGKRTLSPELAAKICTVLKLGKRQTEYFLLLVQHNQSKSVDEKQRYFDRLLRYRATRTEVLHHRHDTFYSRWYHSAIRELVAVAPVGNEEDVVSRLRPSITKKEAEKSLALLVELGLIEKTPGGTYRRTVTAITAGADVDPALVHNFQTATMQLGESALHRFSKNSRDISTLTVSCKSTDLARISTLIARLRDEVSELGCNSTDADQVLQLNIQLFPLSSPPDEGASE
ncbi:MAG: TIGR02147 family protein [Chitinispirillaceae bacterium]|nr:TIGR02147 family protein [Chitinispirillaceae bacterium]